MCVDGPCMDETQAIALVKRGNLTGLAVLVQCYQVKAVYAAYLIVHDRQSAEDVVQAAFLKAVERIDQFDERRAFEPWFMRSVVNAAIDVAKQQTRWLPLEEDTGEDAPGNLDWLTGDAVALEDLVETNELRLAVRRALTRLSPEERAAVVLRHFLNLSESEMTGSLNRPASTIKWWLHSARKKLRELLRPTWNARLSETYEELPDE